MAVVGDASADSCSGARPASAALDRSWIRSNAELFGADARLGVFRFRLNSNRLEPIGAHVGQGVGAFRMSGDHTKLIYESGEGSHWVYDIKTGREIKLESLAKAMKPWDELDYAADRIAWIPRPGDGQTVLVMDLRTRKVRAYALPDAAPDRGTLLFGLTWSRTGNEVLVGRRWSRGEDFWSINARTGERLRVQGRRVADPPSVCYESEADSSMATEYRLSQGWFR
jgi:hypothetical protein